MDTYKQAFNFSLVNYALWQPFDVIKLVAKKREYSVNQLALSGNNTV
jgi:hypothetical protein